MVKSPEREGQGRMIDSEIAAAIQNWIGAQMHERRGPGKDRPGGYEGYSFADMLDVLDTVCPDAIARMLQAGASSYLSTPAGPEIVVGWRPPKTRGKEPESPANLDSEGLAET